MKHDFTMFWKTEISNITHSRYIYYNNVKSNFHIENYLLLDDPVLRSYMAKLRTSTHSLLIEKGRHLGLKKEDRLCGACGVIDNEVHFLFNCS